MVNVGEKVKEAIDSMAAGRYNDAFGFACVALNETIKKALGKEDPTLVDYKSFFNDHWQLISFMCMPMLQKRYLDTNLTIKEISLNPRRDYSIKEIIVFFTRHMLKTGKLPEVVSFDSNRNFEDQDGKLLVSFSLIWGLISMVIVHPVNSEETIPDSYWIDIGDFRMFVSEYWGRIDLAERIEKFHLEDPISGIRPPS